MTEYKLKPAERNNFFLTLRRLTENSGRLPDRMVMADSVDASGKIVASGGFGDVRAGTYMGRRVAVKTARVTERSDLRKIKKVSTRGHFTPTWETVSTIPFQQFYKEVLLWETLSHPNILGLVGVWVDMKKGEFVTVSEWMVHGNIMEFIARYPANRLELVRGLAPTLTPFVERTIAAPSSPGSRVPPQPQYHPRRPQRSRCLFVSRQIPPDL